MSLQALLPVLCKSLFVGTVLHLLLFLCCDHHEVHAFGSFISDTCRNTSSSTSTRMNIVGRKVGEYRHRHRHHCQYKYEYHLHRLHMDNNDDNDDNFMASLQNRIQQSKSLETTLPLIVLDAMLPRQKLTLDIQNQLLINLILSRIRNETPTLGMIGMAKLQNGDTVHLNKGVEVELSIVVDNDGNDGGTNDSDADSTISNTNININSNTVVEFKAGRRFRLDDDGIVQTEQGWTEGKVTFLSSQDEENDEINQKIGSQDPVSSIAKAITKAKEICSPNFNLPNNSSLIERWIDLAKENERRPGQINTLVEELGGVPNENEPSEIAFWIGSLINPLPAMGVAMEIRPQLLMAESAEERVQIAYDGIVRSIKHMDGSARMW